MLSDSTYIDYSAIPHQDTLYQINYLLGGKETPYVQEVYGQTDGEDNAYERTYTRAQAKVAYIEGYVSHFRFRVRFRFRFWFRRTRYCPVHMTRHTKVVRLRIIDRLCQTGVSSCKWTCKLTSVWYNLSITLSRTTFVCLVICTGQYLVWRKQNRKRNRKRTRKRKWETEPSIYATSAWARVYVRTYALSSPSVCPYTSLTYGVSFTSQQYLASAVFVPKVMHSFHFLNSLLYAMLWFVRFFLWVR